MIFRPLLPGEAFSLFPFLTSLLPPSLRRGLPEKQAAAERQPRGDELLGKNIVGGNQNSIRMSGRIFLYAVCETG